MGPFKQRTEISLENLTQKGMEYLELRSSKVCVQLYL